jgi:hypothetical protein
MSRSAIIGSYSLLFLLFWGTSILFSIAVALIYIPTNSVEVFLHLPPCPTSSSVICCCVLDGSYFDQGEVESQCCFDLHAFYGQRCWAFLHMFIGHSYIFWELSVQFVCSFIHWVVDSLRG